MRITTENEFNNVYVKISKALKMGLRPFFPFGFVVKGDLAVNVMRVCVCMCIYT